MLNIFKNSAVVLVIVTLIIFSAGCSKKKEQTNLKACGTYEIKDHWYMTISGETMDGNLDYTMTILPVGENDTISIGNINQSFDDVLAIYRNDSIFIPAQTMKSKSGKNTISGSTAEHLRTGSLIFSSVTMITVMTGLPAWYFVT